MADVLCVDLEVHCEGTSAGVANAADATLDAFVDAATSAEANVAVASLVDGRRNHCGVSTDVVASGVVVLLGQGYADFAMTAAFVEMVAYIVDSLVKSVASFAATFVRMVASLLVTFVKTVASLAAHLEKMAASLVVTFVKLEASWLVTFVQPVGLSPVTFVKFGDEKMVAADASYFAVVYFVDLKDYVDLGVTNAVVLDLVVHGFHVAVGVEAVIVVEQVATVVVAGVVRSVVLDVVVGYLAAVAFCFGE